MKKHPFKVSGRNYVWLAAACLAALATLGLASGAGAQDIQWSANAAGASDYVFRGVSQTQGDPAISAGVDLTVGGVYAGAWASNVDFADSTDAEVDVYAGWRAEAVGWSWDVGAIGYVYAGQPVAADYDYVELKAATSRSLGSATVGAAVYWSPDFFGAAEDQATYVEANASWSPGDSWTLSGALGRQFISSDFDYTTWNLGATYRLTDNLAVDLRYQDTDEHDFGAIYDGRAVATLKAGF